MAKRKRLSAPNPGFVAPPMPESRMPAPIAGVAADAATTAALDEMADALHSARREGRMILSLPLDSVDLGYLVRDRIAVDDDAMQALMASIRARGQQVPIEVAELGPDRYGLISGWRRCHALQRLAADDPRFATVMAVLRRPEEASDAYLSMVEENEIRVGLSYYERARIVVKSTLNRVFETEKQALNHLFQSGSRARRSKIGTFTAIVHALDGALRFPEAIPERMGLTLGRALRDTPGLAARLRKALVADAPDTAEDEAVCLAAGLKKTDSKKAKTVSERAAVSVQPCAGLTMTTHGNGRVTLSGPQLDTALRAKLLNWLRTQG
jgi:hypothetical protein